MTPTQVAKADPTGIFVGVYPDDPSGLIPPGIDAPVPEADLHVTVWFLGVGFSQADADRAFPAVRAAALTMSTFDVALGPMGVMSDVTIRLAAATQLHVLRRRIEFGLHAQGFTDAVQARREQFGYAPHMTVAKVTNPSQPVDPSTVKVSAVRFRYGQTSPVDVRFGA